MHFNSRHATVITVIIDGNRGVQFLPLFVCLFLRTIILKTNVARITKPDKEMFHDESWKPIYLGREVKGQGQGQE